MKQTTIRDSPGFHNEAALAVAFDTKDCLQSKRNIDGRDLVCYQMIKSNILIS